MEYDYQMDATVDIKGSVAYDLANYNEDDEARMDIIGRNGNDGEHYVNLEMEHGMCSPRSGGDLYDALKFSGETYEGVKWSDDVDYDVYDFDVIAEVVSPDEKLRDELRNSYRGWPSKATQEFNDKKAKYLKQMEAAKRKAQPVCTGVLMYFPNAIKAVSEASKVGNDQHHADKPLHWDMSKSKDEADCLVRHLIDGLGDKPMDDDGVHHLAKVAWRALALLERTLTNKF